MKRIALPLICVLIIATLGWYFFLRTPKNTAKNAILIVLDTTRADHLSPYGYERDTTPNLAKFAAESVIFNRAISVAPWTPPSISAMITGRYASSHGMMPPNGRELAEKASAKLDDRLETLAELLHAAGYQTQGVTPNPWTSSTFGFGQGYEMYYFRERARAEEITAAANKILDSFEQTGAPFFGFFHYLDPHEPYDAPAPYDAKYNGPLTKRTYPDRELKALNRYDGEMSYLDFHLGTLFESLKKRGLYDNTLIVIVADHGEQFGERGAIGHGFKLYDEEIHVPLMVKAPGRAPERIDYTVSNLDVFATILEFTGVAKPKINQSISLFDEKAQLQRTGVMSEIIRKVNWKAFTTLEHKKLIMDYGSIEEALPTSEPKVVGLYDTVKDPLELNPINDPALIKTLQTALHSQLKEVLQDKFESQQISVSPETLEQLKSLGYMK